MFKGLISSTEAIFAEILNRMLISELISLSNDKNEKINCFDRILAIVINYHSAATKTLEISTRLYKIQTMNKCAITHLLVNSSWISSTKKY